jgi:integrase
MRQNIKRGCWPVKFKNCSNTNKHLNFASGVFKYSHSHGYIEQNPVEGLRIRETKRSNANRAPFNEQDLKILFHSQQYLEDTHLHSYSFWFPVLALYTGCCLEELCKLHTDDIKQIEAVSRSFTFLTMFSI